MNLEQKIEQMIAVQEYEQGDVVIPSSCLSDKQIAQSNKIIMAKDPSFDPDWNTVIWPLQPSCVMHDDPESILMVCED